MELNIHEHKRYYYAFDNSLLFTESIQNTTPNLSTLNQRPVSSVSAPGHWHNAIRVRAKPCVHRLVFPDTPAEDSHQTVRHS